MKLKLIKLVLFLIAISLIVFGALAAIKKDKTAPSAPSNLPALEPSADEIKKYPVFDHQDSHAIK